MGQNMSGECERCKEHPVDCRCEVWPSRCYICDDWNYVLITEEEPKVDRMKTIKKAGLIGCLNDTGVTSQNYKAKILEDVDRKKVEPKARKD